jgi:MoaA/NifB/PqqE/SkfB family radical SAM enzyme
MSSSYKAPDASLTAREVFAAWGKILRGRIPMLSIEITRECPLTCPGCYAFGEAHLGGGVTLRELSDSRGDALVEGVLRLVRKHEPLHVSLVGGEPLMRHRELSKILPALSARNIFSLVVTSGVIPVPAEWMNLPRVRVAVSIDGLPEHHDPRRKPATYDRILKNVDGREFNAHWVITQPMTERPGYFEEYVAFWSSRPEVNRIWVSFYTPQIGEKSEEVITPAARVRAAHELTALAARYPKLLFNQGLANAFITPPKSPDDCTFAKMSTNYSADLTSRVEPCVFGGSPDCSQCGCAASTGLHWVGEVRIAGSLKVRHMMRGSIRAGVLANRLAGRSDQPARWQSEPVAETDAQSPVQIGTRHEKPEESRVEVH